jgi:hypothetical protein
MKIVRSDIRHVSLNCGFKTDRRTARRLIEEIAMCRSRHLLKLQSVFTAAGLVALALAGCAKAPPAGELASEIDGQRSPAHLSLGATQAQARDGHASTFTFESTPDLVLHTTLSDSTWEGQTLQIRGTDPEGTVVWSYPHLQRGTSFDAVLPVFGSAAARKRLAGSYSFDVVAPDRTVVAAGSAQFTSSRRALRDAGGAFHEGSSPSTAVATGDSR